MLTVRQIDIKSRRLSRNLFSGEYHSAFKGRGMAFSEVRPYQYGDDVRHIDWNVTARTGLPHVQVFEEERELTVMLLIDQSASLHFGSRDRLIRELAAEVGATLTFSALQNSDRVGALFFSDQVNTFIPPRKGRNHALRIIRDILQQPPGANATTTDLTAVLQYFQNVIKKQCIVFVLSDFLDAADGPTLRMAALKHDLIGVSLCDPLSHTLPDVGLLRAVDAETGQERWVDTAVAGPAYHAYYDERMAAVRQDWLQAGADWLTLRTDASIVQPLLQFFKNRI